MHGFWLPLVATSGNYTLEIHTLFFTIFRQLLSESADTNPAYMGGPTVLNLLA